MRLVALIALLILVSPPAHAMIALWIVQPPSAPRASSSATTGRAAIVGGPPRSTSCPDPWATRSASSGAGIVDVTDAVIEGALQAITSCGNDSTFTFGEDLAIAR